MPPKAPRRPRDMPRPKSPARPKASPSLDLVLLFLALKLRPSSRVVAEFELTYRRLRLLRYVGFWIFCISELRTLEILYNTSKDVMRFPPFVVFLVFNLRFHLRYEIPTRETKSMRGLGRGDSVCVMVSKCLSHQNTAK